MIIEGTACVDGEGEPLSLLESYDDMVAGVSGTQDAIEDFDQSFVRLMLGHECGSGKAAYKKIQEFRDHLYFVRLYIYHAVKCISNQPLVQRDTSSATAHTK